jgi:hypothetical protein
MAQAAINALEFDNVQSVVKTGLMDYRVPLVVLNNLSDSSHIYANLFKLKKINKGYAPLSL